MSTDAIELANENLIHALNESRNALVQANAWLSDDLADANSVIDNLNVKLDEFNRLTKYSARLLDKLREAYAKIEVLEVKVTDYNKVVTTNAELDRTVDSLNKQVEVLNTPLHLLTVEHNMTAIIVPSANNDSQEL